MNDSHLHDFKKIIWQYYAQHGRLFEWRHVDDPYKVFISEVMLQQTQTRRVIEKYRQWIILFPDIKTLANASLKEVLTSWQGLGYNRRGMYLHQAAQVIIKTYEGNVPNDPEKLIELPGIGKATAASICAFAFNNPTLFIETNIRAVYIHFFFVGRDTVHDQEILPLLQATIEQENPREWYYALMDYGVMLKKTMVNPSRKSKHYHKQSKFEGSDRQIRGKILRILTQEAEAISLQQLTGMINKDHARVQKIIQQLIDEKFIFLSDVDMSLSVSNR
jgi:A/G-specific adenine glycosylase